MRNTLNTIEHTEIVPLSEQLDLELESVRRQAIARQEMIEPTDEESRNGWTTESLTKYLTERHAGQTLAVDVNSLHRRVARRPTVQNYRYRPHRWRE